MLTSEEETAINMTLSHNGAHKTSPLPTTATLNICLFLTHCFSFPYYIVKKVLKHPFLFWKTQQDYNFVYLFIYHDI
jgi:hypothetical protein